ncbi:MAG: hypothetical protein EPO68_07995 [Planctomycetota bacterium]|nr:MAG: hypothetical protein EPO68_07995 [Planctomycetota bacterium]
MPCLKRAAIRASGAIAASFLLLAASGCSNSTYSFESGTDSALTMTPQVVGRIELACPAVVEFPIEATIPLPKGAWPEPSNGRVFFLRGPSGKNVHAQAEIVSRYASAADGADVVQMIAHVDRPPTTTVGTTIGYDVIYFAPQGDDVQLPNGYQLENGSLKLPDVIAGLLSQPGALAVRARDAYDNVYLGLIDTHDAFFSSGQLTSGVVLRDGHAVLQARLYTVLQPALAGPTPNTFLPHLFSVHAYVSAYAQERVLALDLRISNGGSGADDSDVLDDPLGREYFRDIELVIPNGWLAYSAVHDPFLGAGYGVPGGYAAIPLVAPIEGGKLHVMPSQAQFERRLVIAPPPDPIGQDWQHAQMLLRRANLAFCQPDPLQSGGGKPSETLWSWWNADTARYFPQRHALPRLDHVSKSALLQQQQTSFNKLLTHLESGASYGELPVPSPNLGWAHPWGVGYGGMSGGDEIVLWDGIECAWSASNSAYRMFELVHRMNTDRQPVALYDRDGDPTRIEQWVLQGPHGPYVDMFFYMTLKPGNDPFGFDKAPKFQEQYVQANGLAPDWEAALALYEPHDQQHLVRYLRAAQVLAWLGNDALAKDDLLMQAELVRLSYHPYFNSIYDHVSDTSLKFDQQTVAAHPHSGFDIGRGEGWAFQALNIAYALGTPAWRSSTKPLFDQIVDLVSNGQSSCTGILQSYAYEKILEGKYHARQSIEQAILENALWSMLETVYRDADALHATQLKAVLAMSTTSMTSFPAWSEALDGPLAQVAVSPLDPSLPPFCDWLPYDGASNWVDDFQTWSSFAYGYELTKLPVFLVRAQQMAKGPLLQKMQAAGTANLGNRAALLRLAQDL